MKNLLQSLRRVVRQDKATRQAVRAMGFEPAPRLIRVTGAGFDVLAHFNADWTYWTERIS